MSIVRRLVVALLLTLALAVARAPGQAIFTGGMDEMDEPPVTSADVERMAEIFELSEDQRDAIANLHQAMLSEFERAAKRMRTIADGMEEEIDQNRDFSILGEWVGVAVSFQRYTERLTKAFHDDARLLLTEDQWQGWPAYERARRRGDAFDRGSEMLSSEHVDLIGLVEEMNLPEEVDEDVRAVLRRYELDLDRMLVEMEAEQEEQEEEIKERMSTMTNPLTNLNFFSEQMKTVRKRELRMRKLTESYAARIRSSLPQEMQPRFTDRFNEAEWPDVYRDNYVTSAFETVLDLEDLTSEQRERVLEARARYEDRLETVNREWTRALRESDEKDKGIFDFFTAREAELQEAESARDELDKQTFDRLKSLLTEKQRARLPGEEGTIDWRSMGNVDDW